MITRKMALLAAIAAALLLAPFLRAAETGEYLIYVGTYTSGTARGIYAYRFQPSDGKAVPIGLVAETANPSFLALHPDHRYLYAVNELEEKGSISAFSVDPRTGRLKFLNKVSSGGTLPCHLAIDRSGRWLLAANYGSGSVVVLPIEPDGKLGGATSLVRHSGSGKDPLRQEGPHAHSVNLAPDNRILLVSDLGLDKVMIYRLDAARGSLEANDPPFVKLSPGSGPRHLSFHPNGHFVYEINELSSSITAFKYEPDRGNLREIETISTLPPDFTGISTTAEIEVHPNGKFVYGSNRGHDSIAVFEVKGNKGMLEPVEYVPTLGKTPRQFAIDPTGNYLLAANQNSDEVVVFRIDNENGTLAPTGTILKIPAPVCVVFVPLDPIRDSKFEIRN